MQIKQLQLSQTAAADLEVWLVEDHRLPIINIEFAFIGGSSLDANQHGLAYLMSALLDEGAGELDDQAFHKALDETATHLHFSATRDIINGSLKMLTKHKERAADLLHMAMFEPHFSEAATARVKAQIIASIRSASTNPSEVAAKKLMKLCFGEHAYGNLVKGSEQSLNALNQTDLVHAAQQNFNADHPYLVIVGDVNESEAEALVSRIFSGRKNLSKPAKQVEEAEFVGIGQTQHHVMDVPQAVVNFALPSVAQNDPSFMSLMVLNHILGGGGFSSRLMEEIREKRGLTYGIHTSLIPLKHGSLITGNAATSADKMAETIKILRQEIEKMHDKGVTDEELENAKTYLTGAYPLRFDTGSKIAHQLLSMQYFDFGIGFIDQRNNLVNKVSKDEIGIMAARLLDVKNMAQVTVGPAE
ncbi:MAG: insulinase family protein [Rhizobiales bacterium]|nr:insulinase family protein [Hyphomicrobiales bacterium]NRB13544.1 insulinase family protein [Hyphomicrobiales bacterium]